MGSVALRGAVPYSTGPCCSFPALLQVTEMARFSSGTGNFHLAVRAT